MRFTPLGRLVLFILAIGVAVGGWRFWKTRTAGSGGGASGGASSTAGSDAGGDQGLLGRPLRVGVVTWPGYCGGLVANNGFKPNKDCLYWNNHKLLVQFMLMEDVDARAKAFARGGKDGVDIVWSTV